MGVDYTANYGIGFEIVNLEFEDEKTEYDNMFDYLDDHLDNMFGYFEIGDGSYTGNENKFFVVINEPFSDGLDNLEQLKTKLENHLIDINIETVGEFDIKGGLLIW